MNSSKFGLHKQDLIDVLEKHVFTSGALAIKAGGNVLAATAAATQYFIGGKLYALAASDMASLVGTVNNSGTTLDMINVFVFTVNAAGTVATTMGTEAAALEDVVFPDTPADEVVIGFVIIDLATGAGTGDFVGGTTDLDDGTVVPSAVYINATAPMRFSTATESEAVDSD